MSIRLDTASTWIFTRTYTSLSRCGVFVRIYIYTVRFTVYIWHHSLAVHASVDVARALSTSNHLPRALPEPHYILIFFSYYDVEQE